MTKAAELAKMGEVLTNSQIGGRRNIIINGAMQVAQRATSATGLGDSDTYAVCDRWKLVKEATTAGRLTMSQDSSAPSGFGNSLKLDCTTADTSIAAGEVLLLQQRIEGQNLQAFAKGTSDAKEFSVSFYVKGNASATYVCELHDQDNSRQCSKTFNVTTSWTRIELLFPADTTGAFDDDNARSLNLNIALNAGSDYTSGTLNSSAFASNTDANRYVGITSFFDSTDRTFFITGVQLEVGSQATPFEHRSFGEELELCSRYFQKISSNSNDAGHITNGMITSDRFYGVLNYNKQMRAAPTITGTSGDFNIQSSALSASGFSIDEVFEPSISTARLRTGSNSNFTDGQGAILRFGEAGSVSIDSEL